VSLELNNDEIVFDLESQLKVADETRFPDIPTDVRDNTKSYPERYDLLKTKIGSKHDLVEIKTLLCSLEQEIQNNTINDELYDKIILLNKHGKGHVESVISRASDLAKCIIGDDNKLSPFEIFILLCAIQIHDIGNMYGRNDHTTSFESDFEKHAKESFISDSVLIKFIFNIAKVHGGKIKGNSDTIEEAKLRYKTIVLKRDVRQRLLAAFLRFADELADDNTRSLDISKMPEYSKIYHAYSNSLHTVKIEKEEKENAYFVKLCYFMSIQQAFYSYKKLVRNKNGEIVSSSIPLIREILERIIKMERERRYCSRYLLPYIILKHIKVEIEIDIGVIKLIEFTIRETGYPDEKIELPQSLEDDIAELEKMDAITGGKSNE
jgi:hypothetical protein